MNDQTEQQGSAPFDVTEALRSGKAWTRDGREVTGIGKYEGWIVGRIQGESTNRAWCKNGSYMGRYPDPNDLQNSPDTDEGEVKPGYWFYSENGHEITVMAVADEWCMVKEENKKRPQILPLEFVQAIKDGADNSPK